MTRSSVIGAEEHTTAEWIESRNPSRTSQIVARCAKASPRDAELAVAAAKRAFVNWRDVSAEDRAALLDRVAEILHRERFCLAAIEVYECGKPWREADADVAEAIDFCRYYAEQMRELASPRGMSLPGEENVWTYDARGVVVAIAPWNFPLAILCGMTAAAVVAGNTAIMKPAEQSSLIAAHLMDAYREAGAAAGRGELSAGRRGRGWAGPGQPSGCRDGCVYWIQRAVGLAINQNASMPREGQTQIKRILTELGGKNAIIVDDDADLDDAVTGIVASSFGYSGQKCSACSRLITLPGIHETLLAR